MKVRIDNLVKAISLSLDLVETHLAEHEVINDSYSDIFYPKSKFTNHCKKVTYIALELAKELNLPGDKVKKLYLASLIHDIGAISSPDADLSKNFIKYHCIKGAELLQYFPFYSDISEIILYHHENWNGSSVFKLKENEIPIESQIIRIADLIAFQLFDENILSHSKKLCDWIVSKKEIIFSDTIVNAFMRIAKKEYFWFNLNHVVDVHHIMESLEPKIDVYLTISQLEDVAYIFSKIIDSKSKFTAKHSREIAKLAYDVSFDLGFSHEKCTKMRIAGLLHDIGKLAIPSSILDKNGSLTDEEFNIIKSHVYYTRVILDSMNGLGEISDWASNHHEKLNGKGYPFHLTDKSISFESRILCVCDIYQALAEDRPYRKGLSLSQSFSIIKSMVLDGSLCPDAVEAVYNTACKYNKI